MVNRIKFRKIYRWFKKNPRFGIVLPDGWFGRPYGNIYAFKILKTADNNLILDFEFGPNKVHLELQDYIFSVSKEKIIFKNNSSIVFNWFLDEKDKWKGFKYKSGKVELISYNPKV